MASDKPYPSDDVAARLTLRAARPPDATLLRRWDEEPAVLASDPDDYWQWEVELARAPDWRAQLMAEFDGRPIGFVQIIDPARKESRYWGAVPPNLRAIDIWIGEADCRGRGFGTRLMHMALARCFADPDVDAVLIDPLWDNRDARRFYERLGFRLLERRRFGLSDGAVYRLARSDFPSPGGCSVLASRP